jgi:enoyl-CoA hydratase
MNAVGLDEEGGQWTLTLRAPQWRNAIDDLMRRELGDALSMVATDPKARTLLVTGEGTAFCAGANRPAMFGDTGRTVAQARAHLHEVYDAFLRLRALVIPSIAAVPGAAVGAGLNLAMACDVRIAGPKASFAAPFSWIGLHPGGGCTRFLVEALGAQRAMALLLNGARLDGAAAVTAGLALELAEDPLARAWELSQLWAALDLELVRGIKSAVGIARRGDFDATLEFESWAQTSSSTKPEIQNAVARYGKS